MSGKCTCIHCRREEFGDAYAMHLYTFIMDSISTIRSFEELGIKYEGIGELKTPGNLRANIECNLDEQLCCLFEEDEESEHWIEVLKQWKLWSTLSEAINWYRKLED